jgi:low affinity Fe/Cu permease
MEIALSFVAKHPFRGSTMSRTQLAKETPTPGKVNGATRGGRTFNERFRRIASASAAAVGSKWAFLLSILIVITWAATGPMFKFSDTWQLVINTATTVLTFLAVFLIQNSQNRDGIAIQAKLDEILIAVSKARTELVGIENLTDAEVAELKAAIEREALETEVDEEAPTVEEILKNRNNGD